MENLKMLLKLSQEQFILTMKTLIQQIIRVKTKINNNFIHFFLNIILIKHNN